MPLSPSSEFVHDEPRMRPPIHTEQHGLSCCLGSVGLWLLFSVCRRIGSRSLTIPDESPNDPRCDLHPKCDSERAVPP
jgi:hypothetical protein